MKNAITSYKEANNKTKLSLKETVTALKASRAAAQGSAEAYEGAETAVEGFSTKLLLLRARALLLNAALGIGVGLLVSWGTKLVTDAIQKVDNAVTKTKEASDAATNTTSSLKELIDSYEELGDKSGWDTDDFEQAKDIQDQIISLAKEQSSLDEDKLKGINLQNGKYKEQLEILKQIQEAQVRGATGDYKDSVKAQKKKLVQSAQDFTGFGFLGDRTTVVTSMSDHKMAEDLQAKGFNIFKDIAPLGVTIGPENIKDADSIVEYYNEISRALKYLEENYDEADLESKGVYEGLYNILSAQKDALDDEVSAYQSASDTLKENLEEVGKYDILNRLKDGQRVNLSHEEIDEKVKATKQYKDAVEEAKETEKEWASGGFAKYGNIDNFHRDKIDWTAENRKKYADFARENPDDVAGGYSTVLGSSNEYYGHEVAYTPMLQTDNGLVPLTDAQIDKYLKDVFEASYNDKGELDLDKLMEVDATGLEENINGVLTQVKGMIAGVEGGKRSDGKTLTKADVWAMAGSSNDEIAQALYGGEIGDYSGMGWLSRYVGKSMHDAQATAQEGKDKIEAVYQELYDDLENQNGQRQGSNPVNIRFFDHLENAFHTLAESLGKDPEEMKISDVLGLTADGVELTDEQAQAVDTLSAAAGRYGTTIQAVAEAGEENGMFGGIEDAENRIAQTAKDMETLSQQIDNIQKAYKSCSTAVDEYNQYGYMSADSLQSLLSMDYEYLSCMELVNGKLQLNNEAFAQMVASKYADAKVTAVQNAIAQIQAITQDSVKESTGGATDAMDEQVNKLNELSPGLGDAIKGTVGLAAAQELLNAAEEKSTVDPNRVQTILDGLNTQLSVIDSTINTILGDSSKIKTHLNGFDKNKNNGSSASKSVTDVASAFDTLTKAMKEYNQYGYISADTMKSLVKLEDKFTSCLVKNGNKLEVNANAFRKLVEEQLKKEAETGKDTKSTAELNRILSYLDKNVHSATISFEQLTDVIKGYGSAMDEALEKTNTIKSAFSDLYSVGLNKQDNDFGFLDSDDFEKKFQAIRDLYDNTDLFTNQAYKDALNLETGEINYESDVFKQMFADYLAKLATTARETGGEAGEYLAKGFEDAAAKISQNVMSIREYIDGIGSSLERANNQIDSFQSAFSDIKDIVEEYNTYGGLSIDNYQKLMSLSDDQIKCLKLEGNQIKFNSEQYKKLLIDRLDVMIDEYDKVDQTKALAQRLRELKSALEESGDGFTGAQEKAQNFESTLSSIKDLLGDLIGIFEKLNDKKSNDLKIQGDAWIDVIDKRIDALNEQNEAQERAIDLQKAEDALAKAKANKTVRVYGENGYEWQADENAVREAQSELSSKRREYEKQDEIDRLNKLKDKVQETNNLIGTSWDDYQKKLAYTAQFEAMTFEQMEGHYDTFKDSVLANMKTVQSATNVSNIISNLTNLIETLVKLNDVISMITSGTTQSGGIAGLFNKFTNAFNILTDKSSRKGFWGRLLDAGKSFLNIGGSGNSNPFVDSFQATTQQALPGITSNTTSFLGSIKDTFVGGLNKIFSGSGGILNTLGKGLGSFGSMISSGFGQFTGMLGGFAKNIGTAVLGEGGILSGISGLFKGIGTTVMGAVGGSGGLAAAVTGALSHIPVIGTILLGGSVVLGAIGDGSIVNGIKKIGTGIGNAIAGLGKTLGKVVKSVGGAITNAIGGLFSMLTGGGNSSSGGRGILSTLWHATPLGVIGSIFGFAKGTTAVPKDDVYNVDEEGEEMIVRAPEKGRLTTLEKGDGVIPADQTETLMDFSKNPVSYIRKAVSGSATSTTVGKSTRNISKVISGGDLFGFRDSNDTSSSANGFNATSTPINAIKKVVSDSKLRAFEKMTGPVGNEPSSEYTTLSSVPSVQSSDTGNSIKPTIAANKKLMDMVGHVAGSVDDILEVDEDNNEVTGTTLGKAIDSLGLIQSGMTFFGSDTVDKDSNAIKATLGSAIKTVSGSFSSISSLLGFKSGSSGGSSSDFISVIKKFFGFSGGSTKNSMDNLLDTSKSKTLSQLDSMKSQFEKTWKDMAKEVGLSEDDIESTSEEMYDKMTKLVNDTYNAIGDNTALSADQVEGITKTLFQSMQNTYTSGWNRMASLSDDMSQSTADKMANAFNKMKAGCSNTMDSIASKMKNSWKQCGGGVRNLSAKTENTISKAWADTTGNTQKMLYDMRACFDDSWGMAESGVRDLADNVSGTVGGAYTTIASKSEETLGKILPDQMAAAWKNVEPGATDLAKNTEWVMDQAYDNITKSCNDTVTSIRDSFSTVSNELYDKGQTVEEKKESIDEPVTKKDKGSSSSSNNEPITGGKSILDTLKDLVNKANSAVGGLLKKTTTDVVIGTASAASNLYNKGKETASNLYNSGKEAASNLYNKGKETVSNMYNSAKDTASKTVDRIKDTASKGAEKVKETASKIAGGAKDLGSKASSAIKSGLDKLLGKKASGSRSIQKSGKYNVDEQGSELLVRQPQAGRYTYLETGDGVVPTDITSRLFQMGGNPDAWFQDQMSKYGNNITSGSGYNLSVTMGNIVISNPVGSSDDLAKEIVRELPNKLSQRMNAR